MKYDKSFFDKQFENFNERDGNVWRINWRASQVRRLRLATEKIEAILSRMDAEEISGCEIGCATGDFTAYYFELCKRNNGKLICYDLSDEAIKICRRKFKGNISFKQGNIIHLDEPDGCFDMIVCMEVLHYFRIEDMGEALKEVKRIKKRDGYAFFSLPLTERDQWGDEYCNAIKEQFEIVSIDYVDNWFYQKHFEPRLLWIYDMLDHEKVRKIVWKGFREGIRRLLSSIRLLEIWLSIGRILKCRKNSHIMLTVR